MIHRPEPEDEPRVLDESTGSNHSTEFASLEIVDECDNLDDDEIFRILNYALRINK